MRRREFIGGLGSAALLPLRVRAQQTAALPLIGVLSPLSSTSGAHNIDAFRDGLQRLGYVEGRNIRIELRFAEGALERLPTLAAELAALKPAVIIAGSPAAALAVRNVTRTIPIVMNSSENPITLGLATSLARPGGNVTGFWWGDEGLTGKQLELLKELVPDAVRVGIMVDPAAPNTSEILKALQTLRAPLGLQTRVIEVRGPSELATAFAAAARESLQALHVELTPLFLNYRTDVTAFAANARLPTIYGTREFAVAGGLVSYGANLSDLYRDKARLVDQILKGTSPADLPIERPTNFELVVNLKAANALGLKVADGFQLRADEVIE